jgi:hypothetical protein
MPVQQALASDHGSGFETVFVASDPNERMVAESLLHEAGIPFESRNEDLQDLFGLGQIGGTNLIVGPVKLQAPTELAAEARSLLESGVAVEVGKMVGEIPAELEAPPLPPDPRLVKVRRLALASVVCSFFIFAPIGLVLGVWALAIADESVALRWKLFAAVGVLYSLFRIVMLMTFSVY